MPACLLCKKEVTSGYVLCGDCAGELKTGTMQPVLNSFAAWLGESIAHDHTIVPCSICEFGKSNACLNLSMCGKGITAWLRAKTNEFMETCGYNGILGRLKTVCPFPKVFEDVDDTDGPSKGEPRRKIGHIRADYDNYRWWNTAWGSHWDLATTQVKAEIDHTYEALTANDALRDLNALRRFCWTHPEARCSPLADDEFNFYLLGESCDFWVRLITREQDYNLYLHAYAKEGRK